MAPSSCWSDVARSAPNLMWIRILWCVSWNQRIKLAWSSPLNAIWGFKPMQSNCDIFVIWGENWKTTNVQNHPYGVFLFLLLLPFLNEGDPSSFPVNSNEIPLQRTQNDQSGIMTNFVHIHCMGNCVYPNKHMQNCPPHQIISFMFICRRYKEAYWVGQSDMLTCWVKSCFEI